ncbi:MULTISPECIES: AAA family ATPase [Thioclava]|uniref:AAA family ATPase n=1 Tax=Thioclava TaxID=285107 RepID=UPI0009989FE3|nr:MULTISPECIES: AAA family ATPase [Thioclava]MAQ38155.1 AAA family ATPase [Thioclava sp.]
MTRRSVPTRSGPRRSVHFQIADIRFFPSDTANDIETRLSKALSELRRKNLGIDEDWFSNLDRGGEWSDVTDQISPSRKDRDKIRRRAQKLVELRQQASRMSHLSYDERKKLSALQNGVQLIQLESEHRVDEIAAALHEEMPWMSSATEFAWYAMRESMRKGAPALRLPPLLLDGPPGIGKSHWARRLAELIGTPTELIDASNEPAGFAVAGSQRGWSTAHPGRPVELILHQRVGNPVIVIDEVDKCGDVRSSRGFSFALSNALLPLLDPLSARTWSCPFFRVRFDMRWISWILTSNDRLAVPAPLQSRCRVVYIPPLAGAHLAYFARREGAARGLPADTVDALTDMLRGAERGWDLRAVIKLIDTLVAHENRPPLQ